MASKHSFTQWLRIVETVKELRDVTEVMNQKLGCKSAKKECTFSLCDCEKKCQFDRKSNIIKASFSAN